MFENIIEQAAASRLRDDILAKTFAPSMLFYGPCESGKGSAALELARSLSCEKDALWKCVCPSCERHRYLQHDDVLMLGKKTFSSEIAACGSVFLKNTGSQGGKLLFFRSLRKLQIRFSPLFMEDDQKMSKLSAQLQSFDERLSELLSANTETTAATAEKLCASLVKDAQILEEEGLSSLIPIAHIRRASYWCRLAPNGKRKTLVIENADNMRDEARNSLLKLLEEPPTKVNIILTTQRKETVIPTILSRLRQYRFLKRSAEGEKEVLRRVFQAPENFTGISAYLNSFQSANEEKLLPLAEWFVSQDFSAAGAQTVKTLLAKSGNFENDSFSRFLRICLDLNANNIKRAENPQLIPFFDSFKKHVNEAVTAVDVLNQSVTLALEALLFKLKRART